MSMAANFSSLDDNISQSSVVSYIQSQKGKPLLVLDNCIFKLNKTTITTKYWTCTCIECSMKVHTNVNDQLVKIIGEHCHPTEQELIHVREFRAKVKQRAIDETTPIPRIYDEDRARGMLSNVVIALLPSKREINNAVNKAHRVVIPTIPITQLFDFPDVYTKTLRTNSYFVSLTFPCVFGLLPNRHKNTYSLLFHELRNVALQMKPDFSPKIIMGDFESGLASAAKSEFSTAKHSSCYFHFSQAVYRNIQQLGLGSMYNDDDNVKSFCRKLMTLPLLPEIVIEDAYDDVVGNFSPDIRTVINDLLEYFQRQWFLKVPTSQWCVHGLCIRTNNNAE
ncbi:unnamed protein product, partial [Rotaria sp. Silwood1]